MKIALLTDFFTLGGGCEYIYNIAAGMPEHQFSVFARGGNFTSLEKLPNVKIIIRDRISAVLVNAEKCSLIHSNHLKTLLWLNRNPFVKLNSPLIHTVHGIHLRKYQFQPGVQSRTCYGMRLMLERLLYQRCTALIALTNSDRDFLVQKMKISTPIRIIPNGIPVTNCLGQTPLATNMCMIGRFDFMKGYDILVQAVSKRQHELRRKQCTIQLIGDGKLRPEIHRLIQKNSVADILQEQGAVVDAGKHLAAGSVVIMPSRWEGLPFLVLEAGMRRCLVIASDVCGLRDCIENGKSGLLFPCEDSDALGELLVNDYPAEKIFRYGDALNERVCRDFNLTKMVERTRALYREMEAQSSS